MKLQLIAPIFLTTTTIIGYSNTSIAETCYTAEGTVATENITSTLQMGNISLTLSDSNGTVFSKTGSLVGNITGANGIGNTLLSHTAKFSNGKGNMFVTNGDEAVLVPPYVRDTLDDGRTPCSFWIHETISNIASGTGFFGKVTDVEIFADGYISNCPNENSNYFELSGEICKK